MKKQTHSLKVIWVAAAVLLLVVCLVIIGVSGNGTEFPVYISEILASNTGAPNADGRCADFIEIHNGGTYAVDLTGYQLGDIAGGLRYAFPSGTVLQPGRYLVVWCDKEVDSYAPFGISRSGGESFYLIASNNAIVDHVVTVATDPDQAMIRSKNGEWSLSATPTPGMANSSTDSTQDIYNATVSPVRINEFSSASNGYDRSRQVACDWVELKNTATTAVDISGFTLSDNPGNNKYTFPAGTVLQPGGYLVVYCAENVPGLAPFNLSQSAKETVVLKDAAGMIVEIVQSLPLEKGAQALQADGSWKTVDEPTPGFENTEKGLDAFLNTIGAENILITEIMSSQDTLIPDENGQFNDYIELYNSGNAAVDLSGWWLSDDAAVPNKWTFPETTIDAGGYLVLHCGSAPEFNLSADGEEVVLSTFSGTVVSHVVFGKAEVNRPFDGNGQLLEKATPGFPNTDAGYKAFGDAHVSAGPLAIWEVMTSNDKYLPQALGVCYDWVEIKNISTEAVNLSDYYLTDDPDSPRQFRLPDVDLAPGATHIIFLSGDTALGKNHAPFALNAAKDRLLLYCNTLVDYVYLTEIPVGMSYGRTEGIGGFSYMEPSPKNPNKAGYREISAMPTSDRAAGVYSGTGPFTLELKANGNIYYTTTGDEPSTKSTPYSGPITVTENTVIRAISCEDGKLPSSIYTVTYVTGRDHDLPVVSLVTDPDYLWGPRGVYRNGDEDVKEIKFPANVAYAGSDGSFSIDNEMSLHGATTVIAFDKKSFTLRFKDNLDGPLYYDVFEDGEVEVFSSLLLRTSHESTFSTQLHDSLMSEIAQQGNSTLVVQKYKYVSLYLNGQYWGLYAIREQHTPEHYASYYNVPADTVSMVRFAIDEKNSLNEFYKFCKTHPVISDQNYEYAKTVLHMESFADWIILQAYIKNVDIYENVRYYHSTVDGLWHLALSDLDLGFMSTGSGFGELQTTFIHGVMVSSLMTNKQFQKLMAERLAFWLNGPLSDENMLATIERMEEHIRSETPYEEQRWNTPIYGWEMVIKNLKRHCTGRAEYMKADFRAAVNWSKEEMAVYFKE